MVCLNMPVVTAATNLEFALNLISLFFCDCALSGVISVALHFLLDPRFHLQPVHALFIFLRVKQTLGNGGT